MSATLHARDLAKRFGTLEAVHDVDIAVAPGEIVGLLGPNGAGKTTTLAAAREALEQGQVPGSGVALRSFSRVQAVPRGVVGFELILGAYALASMAALESVSPIASAAA